MSYLALPSLPLKLFGRSRPSIGVPPASLARKGSTAPATPTLPHEFPVLCPALYVPPKRKLPGSGLSANKRHPSRSPSVARSKASKPPPVDTLKLRNDPLGTIVRQSIAAFNAALSWESFVTEFRGRSYLSPGLDDIDHPAAALLRRWRDEGVPAESHSTPWTDDQKDECIRRGCHQSAKDHADFLRDEMAGFIHNRFWVVLPYELV